MWRAGVIAMVVPILLGSCAADQPGTGRQPSRAGGSSTSTPTESVPKAEVEAVFLRITAAHMCEVQGTVYDGPEDLAAAYDSQPDYPGLDQADVTRLRDRLEEDARFSAELNDRVTARCG